MLEESEIEGLAVAVVRSAGLDPTVVVGALALARRVAGPVRVLPASGLPGDGCLARVGGERRICLRGRLPPLRQRWAILHEVAEAVLLGEAY